MEQFEGVEIIGLDGQPTTAEELHHLYGNVGWWNMTPPCYKLIKLEMMAIDESPIPVRVRVLDGNGQPAQEVPVYFGHEDGHLIKQAPTDASGEVVFDFDKHTKYAVWEPGDKGSHKIAMPEPPGDQLTHTGQVIVGGAPNRVLWPTFQWVPGDEPPPDPTLKARLGEAIDHLRLVETALSSIWEDMN